MPLTTNQANAVLDSLLGSSSPTNVLIGLSTTLPTITGGNVTEPSVGAGYVRQTVANNATNWPAAANRTKVNNVKVSFPQSTGPWGTVRWWVLYNATTTSVMAWGAITTPIDVPAGSEVYFPIGSLIVTVTTT